VIVCSCNVLSDRDIRATIDADGRGPRTAYEAYCCLGCSPDCGRCAATIRAILAETRTVCAAQCAACHDRSIACAVHIALPQAAHSDVQANDIAA
jgi:bacterioferritin-associated ferredoxin